MKIKKYYNSILVIVLLISILGLNFTINKTNDDSQKLSCLKLDSIPESLSELTEDSDSVILGIPEEDSEIIEYKGVTFYLTKIKVQKNYYGDALESFTLLQTYSHEDPIVSPNESLVLFLSKYSGPISDDSNVYVATGLGYGQYSLETNNISKKLDGHNSLEINKINPALNDSISSNIIKDYQTLNSLEKALYDINSSKSVDE